MIPCPRLAVSLVVIALLAILGAVGGKPLAAGTPSSLRGASAGSGNPQDTIRVGVIVGGRARVSTLEVEDYVARVVAAEGEAQAADAAQQALAITVRTFALANRQRHRREGYDLCDTTHCQVMRTATPSARRASLATAGRVLVRDGRTASVFYSASCGGQSELASAVWPGAIDYISRSQRDDACKGRPEWSSELRVEQIERALRAAGHRGGRLRELRVLDRNASDRVARLRIDGFTPGEIAGHDFRMAVGRVAGWQQIRSTAFEVRRTGDTYRFAGRGFGHGVGLCVIGAGGRAASGSNADDILRFYFPRLRVTAMEPSASRTADARPPAVLSPSPGRDAPPDVLLALPATEETERAAAMLMIRAARDQIAKAAGLRAPPSIRVTVHPDVEAFGRATGQPWWVPGATEGTSIDLLPLTMLRQQGQLERAIRHEMAHVLLDGSLARRPQWVREGAALYFSGMRDGESDVAGGSGRLSCPADAEFQRPLSAGAHRSAHARAEACFRRAVASGRRWDEVR